MTCPQNDVGTFHLEGAYDFDGKGQSELILTEYLYETAYLHIFQEENGKLADISGRIDIPQETGF